MPDRQVRISHVIGPEGRCRLGITSGSVRIEGTDGDVADVQARYELPPGIDPAADPEQDGVLAIGRAEGELSIAVRDQGTPGILGMIGRLVGAARPEVHVVARIPRTANLRLDSISADAEVRGTRGEQDLRTVSGDVRVVGAGGSVRLTSISGDLVVSGDVLSLRIDTTSGSVAVDAELLRQFSARAVSGDVSVRSALAPGTRHACESVSGDLELATPSGLTIELSGLSGSVRSDLPMRREQRDGRRLTIIGDGAAEVRMRTVSGSLRVSGPRRRGPARPDERPAAKETPNVVGAGAGWPAPPAPPAVLRLPTPPMPPAPAVPQVPSRPSTAPPAPSSQLLVLQALERGEIDVEEAIRQLEAMGHDR